MKKILVLTRYDNLGASSRYRFYQFLPFLEKEELSSKVYFLLSNGYLENLYEENRLKSFLSVVFAYVKRFVILLSLSRFDLIWLEKELFPWLPGFLELILLRLGPPYIVDYDDAIFHRYDQHRSVFVRTLFRNKIKKIMRGATVVIAGNRYIANYAEEANAKIVKVIPTVLNPRKYHKAHLKRNERFTIGWIGSPSTSRHLSVVHSALKEITKNDTVNIVTVGAQPTDFQDLQVSVIPWLAETEVEDLRSFDIGIMPLPDTEWERGKCGFKLIQYMAAGLPVIASPVGINREIVDHGLNGFLARDTEEWVQYFKLFKGDLHLRRKMGAEGRKKVEEQYSLPVVVPRLIKILKEAVKV